jgi:ATP-dependent Clp protease adaptor protein ClpS
MLDLELEEVVELKETKSKENILVLFNDHVNTFDHVIDLLVKVCDHDVIQAEQCATLVHFKGKCAIKRGIYKDLKLKAEILGDAGLTVEIN